MQAAQPGDDTPAATIRSFLGDLDSLVSRDAKSAATVEAVKLRLARLLKECPSLPAPVRQPSADHYARHLLYGDPDGRYEIVIMAWSPGQATPIHDHSGIWCVEGVVEGVIDVTRYDLTDLSEGRARMRPTEVIHAGLGQCGALIPPVEYHSISNPYGGLALTMHVYGGRMRSCRIFTERSDGLYDVSVRELSFSSPAAAIPPA